MWLQPIVYFAAVAWALAFAAFGIYLLFRRAATPLIERLAGFVAAVLVATIGAGICVGIMYLIQELF
jgi:hypothetical protein